MDSMDKIKTNLTILFKLNKYMNNLEKLMKNPIDTTKAKDYYIINKDIVSRYVDSELYKEIEFYNLENSINNNQEITDIDSLVQDFMHKKNIETKDFVDNSGIKPIFLSPETLKLKCYEYPNNFFILEEDIFHILGNNNTVNKNKTFIGKEGIFIEKYFKDFENSDKLSIYFIKSMDKLKLDNFRLNKIYIFNKEAQFLKEFNTHMKGKMAESYFASRNFVDKGGIFNITDNGKKIGLYININRVENYQGDENEIDENRKYLEKFLE